MIDNNTMQFYINNFEGLIEDVSELKEVDQIKKTSYPHARARIDEFEATFKDLDERSVYVNRINEMILETELRLQDRESLEQLSFLTDIQNYIKSKFPDVRTDGNGKLTCEEKIIMLDYLGVLKQLDDFGLNQKQQSLLLSFLLERSSENIKKAIANVGGKVMKGNVKNERSLSSVKSVIEKLNSDSLFSKLQEDIAKLN